MSNYTYLYVDGEHMKLVVVGGGPMQGRGGRIVIGDQDEWGNMPPNISIILEKDQLWTLFRLMQDWKEAGADTGKDFESIREVLTLEEELKG